MYLNIRGLKSKYESFLEKVTEVEPTLICITETHLLEIEPLDIDGYEIYRNDINSNGGILFGVRKELKNVCTIVENKKEIEESLWLVINNSQSQIRIGGIYAPQESRTSEENLKKMYDSIEEQIDIGRTKQQNLLIIGDFNCKVGDAIKNNRKEITKAGKLLLKMVNKNKLLLLNSSEKCEGTWTREE